MAPTTLPPSVRVASPPTCYTPWPGSASRPATLGRLHDLASTREAPPIAARLAHVRPLAAGDAEALEAATDGFERTGALLVAAEACADASRAWRRAGHARRGTAAANRAHLLADRCEGARTPGLAALDAATPLTEREREIALLAARGGTSRAIADQLYLSERTVENHLQRIYTKLGARGRSELHALLGVGAAQARDRGAGGDAERDA